MNLKNIIQEWVSLLFIILGVLLACFGITGFLIPNGLIDGGVTGISMLISQVIAIPLSYTILLVNLPFIIIGFKETKWQMMVKGIIAIFILSYFLHGLHFPNITNDLLLSALFGGIFLGAGIGCAIRGGGVLDGTEVIAIILNKKIHLTVGDAILSFNILIFSCALMFIPIESVMYSILAYFSASKTVDFIVYGIDEYIGILLISEKTSEIRKIIINELGLAATILHGKRGYSDHNQDVLFCVVTRFQVGKFKSRMLEIDPNLFFVTQKISDTSGGLFKFNKYLKRQLN